MPDLTDSIFFPKLEIKKNMDQDIFEKWLKAAKKKPNLIGSSVLKARINESRKEKMTKTIISHKFDHFRVEKAVPKM